MKGKKEVLDRVSQSLYQAGVAEAKLIDYLAERMIQNTAGWFNGLKMKEALLERGWVDKGDVLVRYSKPRLGWKPADGTLIVGYWEWPVKVWDMEALDKVIAFVEGIKHWTEMSSCFIYWEVNALTQKAYKMLLCKNEKDILIGKYNLTAMGLEQINSYEEFLRLFPEPSYYYSSRDLVK